MAKRKRTSAEVFSDLRLPTSGDVVFIPPKNWNPSEPLKRGPQHGYIDVQGREWVKGPSRTAGDPFEWDVQLLNGDHLNVSLAGKITHPKPPKA